MESLKSTLNNSPIGAHIQALWEEYEAQATPESRLVRDLDKLEMVVQAFEYERDQPAIDLADFFNSTRGKFRHAVTQGVDEEVRRRRALLPRASASAAPAH